MESFFICQIKNHYSQLNELEKIGKNVGNVVRGLIKLFQSLISWSENFRNSFYLKLIYFSRTHENSPGIAFKSEIFCVLWGNFGNHRALVNIQVFILQYFSVIDSWSEITQPRSVKFKQEVFPESAVVHFEPMQRSFPARPCSVSFFISVWVRVRALARVTHSHSRWIYHPSFVNPFPKQLECAFLRVLQILYWLFWNGHVLSRRINKPCTLFAHRKLSLTHLQTAPHWNGFLYFTPTWSVPTGLTCMLCMPIKYT